MKQTIIVNGLVFFLSFIFMIALFLAYINYKYDSSCGNTIDAIMDVMKKEPN